MGTKEGSPLGRQPNCSLLLLSIGSPLAAWPQQTDGKRRLVGIKPAVGMAWWGCPGTGTQDMVRRAGYKGADKRPCPPREGTGSGPVSSREPHPGSLCPPPDCDLPGIRNRVCSIHPCSWFAAPALGLVGTQLLSVPWVVGRRFCSLGLSEAGPVSAFALFLLPFPARSRVKPTIRSSKVSGGCS